MNEVNQTEAPAWHRRLTDCLPLYGHRNWIIVADAAYPAQAKPGIETIIASADQLSTVRTVFEAIMKCTHVRADVYTDFELSFVAEGDAPGVSAYCRQLDGLFAGSIRKQLPHDDIIAKLDQSAQVFHILIIKTDMTIPYTSVFFELDCGYWNAAAEARLRKWIETSEGRRK